MSAIAKYLEAVEKATAGPWRVMPDGFSRKNPRPTVYATDSDLRYIAFCDDAMTTGEPTNNIGNAEFIAASRNAADDVRELVRELNRLDRKFRSGNGVPVERATITADEWNRIWEIVSDE